MNQDQKIIIKAQEFMEARGGYTISRDDVQRAQREVGGNLKVARS